MASPEGSGPESSSENHRRHPRGPRGFESRSLQRGGSGANLTFVSTRQAGPCCRSGASNQRHASTRTRRIALRPSIRPREDVSRSRRTFRPVPRSAVAVRAPAAAHTRSSPDVGQHQGLYKAAPRDRPTVGHQVRRRECCYGRVSRAKLPTGRVPVPRWYSETTLR